MDAGYPQPARAIFLTRSSTREPLRLTLREALRTLAALLCAQHVLVLAHHFLARAAHEAYLPTEQVCTVSALTAFAPAWPPSGSSGSRPAPREGSQASHCLSRSARSAAPPARFTRLACLPHGRSNPRNASGKNPNSIACIVMRAARPTLCSRYLRVTPARRLPRLGLAIAARIVGNAVRRNRIKRLIRESFRQHQHELPAVDLVVNARAGARDADNAAITRSLEQHWRTVVKQCAPS